MILRGAISQRREKRKEVPAHVSKSASNEAGVR